MVGFTFCGKHCYWDYGIIMSSKNRTVLPERRRRELEIPQKHGRFTFSGSTYDMRVITVDCIVQRHNISALRQRIREIAGWLAQTGPLVFDDEPGLTYQAGVYSSIPLEQVLCTGLFSLVFDCQPMAYGETVALQAAVTQQSAVVRVHNKGTALAHCLLRLVNTGSAPTGEIQVSVCSAETPSDNREQNLSGVFICQGLAPEESLEIDAETFEVRKNDQLLTTGYQGDFPVLYPGDNDISFSADSLQIDVSVQYTEQFL